MKNELCTGVARDRRGCEEYCCNWDDLARGSSLLTQPHHRYPKSRRKRFKNDAAIMFWEFYYGMQVEDGFYLQKHHSHSALASRSKASQIASISAPPNQCPCISCAVRERAPRGDISRSGPVFGYIHLICQNLSFPFEDRPRTPLTEGCTVHAQQ